MQYAVDAVLEFEAFAKGILGTTGVVTPMAFPHLRGCVNLEVHLAFKRARREMYVPVGAGSEPQVYAFVDGESCHQTMLVVDMCAQWTYPIG